MKVRSRCEAYIDLDERGLVDMDANAYLRLYRLLPILDLRILGVIYVKEFFVGSFELWDIFVQRVDRGPLGLVSVLCFVLVVSSQGIWIVTGVPVREEEEACDSRSNPFQEREDDAGASRGLTRLKGMSNGTDQR